MIVRLLVAFALLLGIIGLGHHADAQKKVVIFTRTGGARIAPVIDGTPVANLPATSGVAVSASQGTSNANDVLVLFTFANTTSGTAPTVSSITGTSDFSGLSWSNTASPNASALSKVFTSDVDGTTSIRVEMWWAKATTSTNNGNLTVTWNAGFDNLGWIVAAFSGCGTPTAPWDVNGSLPATTHSTAGATSAPSLSGISTTSNATIILASVGASRAAGGQYTDQTAGVPFTLIKAGHFAPNVDFSALGAEQNGVTVAQVNSTAAFGVAYNGWIMVSHALVGH